MFSDKFVDFFISHFFHKKRNWSDKPFRLWSKNAGGGADASQAEVDVQYLWKVLAKWEGGERSHEDGWAEVFGGEKQDEVFWEREMCSREWKDVLWRGNPLKNWLRTCGRYKNSFRRKAVEMKTHNCEKSSKCNLFKYTIYNKETQKHISEIRYECMWAETNRNTSWFVDFQSIETIFCDLGLFL